MKNFNQNMLNRRWYFSEDSKYFQKWWVAADTWMINVSFSMLDAPQMANNVCSSKQLQ